MYTLTSDFLKKLLFRPGDKLSAIHVNGHDFHQIQKLCLGHLDIATDAASLRLGLMGSLFGVPVRAHRSRPKRGIMETTGDSGTRRFCLFCRKQIQSPSCGSDECAVRDVHEG